MFYVETRDSHGQLNNIHIEKLKNKLGTRQLPTAELLLDGTPAFLVSALHICAVMFCSLVHASSVNGLCLFFHTSEPIPGFYLSQKECCKLWVGIAKFS